MTEERRLIRPRRPGDEPVAPIVLDTLQHQTGLTKREHFAALCLAGMYANTSIVESVEHLGWRSDAVDIADRAVSLADILIERLAECDRGVE